MKDKKEAEVVGFEIGAIFLIIFLVAAWPAISSYLSTIFDALGGHTLVVQGTSLSNTYGPTAISLTKNILGFLIGLSFVVSFFFLVAIIYCVEQTKHIRKKEEEKYDLKVEPAYEVGAAGNTVLADRWSKVQHHVTSENPNDWRQAILEADIMLEDVLTTLGYRGEGIGEKLKRVEKGDMSTLQDAWEAHLVRNKIAHEGSEFPLTQHEANRVINLYKKVFEEFYYI